MATNAACSTLVLKRAKMLKCPLCEKTYVKENSLRKHCKRTHNSSVSFTAPRAQEERRSAQQVSVKKHRKKKQGAACMQRMAEDREDFGVLDADVRGAYGASDLLIEYRDSCITGAGKGLFACVSHRDGDVLSRYEGEIVDVEPPDPEYAIEFDDAGVTRYIDGIRAPLVGMGMTSFANKETRSIPKARKNCEIVPVAGGLYLLSTCNVKAGSELYTVHSRGYRIKKN